MPYCVCLGMQVFVNILRTSTIIARVDMSLVRYPGIAAAPLVLGTLGGCGGKFLQDALYIGSGRSPGSCSSNLPTTEECNNFDEQSIYAYQSLDSLLHLWIELPPIMQNAPHLVRQRWRLIVSCHTVARFPG